jgi:putative Mn2+ efflux pump MntP
MDKIIENFKGSTDFLNENKYFIGISMIIVNIGARFIIDELDDDTRQYVSNKIVRKIFIFCAIFMATRDIVTSVILTIIFIIIINEFLGKEEEEDKKENKSASYNKGIIDKTIQDLKNVQMNI